MKGIYRFQYECGRMGTLSGVFVADSDDVGKIDGECVYFGEVLGKHSDIEADIRSNDNLKLLSADGLAVEVFETLNLETGHNPFDYWERDDHGDHPDRPD